MLTAYTNCTVLNGTENMEPQSNMTVVTDGEKIISVGNDIPAGSKIVDLGGKYLLPGLINAHVHLPGNGAPKTSSQTPDSIKRLTGNALFRAVIRRVCESYAKTEMLAGVTTIRTVGGLIDIDSKIRDRINSGKASGPRILAANMAVSVPGGHMAGVLAYCAENEEDCRKYVRIIAREKPDLIKLMITGGVLDATVKGEPGVLKMPLELVKAACDEAHKFGFCVAAHVESPEGVRTALEGGVDTIEHGAAIDEETLALFKEKKAADICTISPAIPLAHFDDSVLKSTELTCFNGNIVFEGIVKCAKLSLENGIPVGLGTDTACPFVTHYDMWREIAYFSKYVGVSRKFALYTATLRNAEILGIDSITGSVEPGKSADLLVVDSNPLDDLQALRKPYMVVMRGKAIVNPKIKKIKKIEKALDDELCK